MRDTEDLRLKTPGTNNHLCDRQFALSTREEGDAQGSGPYSRSSGEI